MRNFFVRISSRAKKIKPDFIVVTQNAMGLVVYNGKPDGRIVKKYISSIDGAGCEELFYGHSGDGKRTSKETTEPHITLRKNKSQIIVQPLYPLRD